MYVRIYRKKHYIYSLILSVVSGIYWESCNVFPKDKEALNTVSFFNFFSFFIIVY